MTREDTLVACETPAPIEPRPAPLAWIRRFRVEADPTDAGYRERYAAEMIDGFRIFSLLIFASMSLLFVIHLMEPHGLTGGLDEGPSAAACGLLAAAGGLALLASRFIRSAESAFLATVALLVAAVAVISIDCLRQSAHSGRAANSLLQILLSILVLTAALLPLRPSRMFALGVLLFGASCLAALFIGRPFQVDLVEIVGAAIIVAVSVVTTSRSTSQRIGIHYAHACALDAEQQAKANRERALLAESAITMERLAASLSHELNTPIGVLKSATETLQRRVQKHEGFAEGGSSVAHIVKDLLNAMANSTARLTETVARIQRFANLDRSAMRLVDVNQLVQDAVTLMNPPSAKQTRTKLRLDPLPAIWCRPHALSAAVASILNRLLESSLPVAIETYQEGREFIVEITQMSTETELVRYPGLNFSVVEGHVRASGWDLFAARQLVHENGGRLRVESRETGERVVLITIPADADIAVRNRAVEPA